MRAIQSSTTRLCAWILCTAIGAASARGTFDPARDLDGFETIFRSDLRDLYPVDKYADLLGTELSDAAIAKLREQWTTEKAAGDAEVARLRADPALLQLHVARRGIRADKYLSKIAFEERADFAPCPLFIQKPAGAADDFVARTSASYSAWLEKLAERFDARFGKPLGLERRKELPLVPVVILASTGDFRNYSGQSSRDAFFDEDLGAIVGHTDAFGVERSPVDARVRLLYSFAHALLDAHERAEMPLGTYWFEYGFPTYLTYHTGLTPAALERPEIPRAQLDLVVKTVANREKRETLLFPIAEMVAVPDTAELSKRSKAIAKRLKIPDASDAELVECFRAQVVLSMHFLLDGHGEGGRSAFLAYLKARFAGTPDRDAFFAAYPESDRARLDAVFYDYVFAKYAEAFPAQTADRTALEGLFASRAAAEPEPTPAASSPAPPPPPFDPKSLALKADDVESQHALALAHARAGDLDEARARLTPFASRDAIAREIERVDGLIALRRGYFESLASAGTKWVGEYEGKKIVAPITKVDGEFLHLGENRLGITKIPLRAVPLADLAKQADKKEKQGSAPAWARSYAYLLCGEEKWDKSPKDESPASKSLRADAKGVYPAALKAANAAAAIDALASASLPQRPSEADAALAAIEPLLRTSRDVPLVAARLAGLRELALASLVIAFGEAGIAGALAGQAKVASDGRTTVTYEFDAESEAQDFEPAPQVMRYSFKAHAKGKDAPKPLALSVKGGDLELSGFGALKHRLRLAGAFRIELEFQFVHIPSNETANPWFEIFVHGDGQDSAILVNPRGAFYVTDTKTNYDDRSSDAGGSMLIGADYKLELVGDGQRVTTRFDGEKAYDAAYGPRGAGALGLLVRCETPVRIHRLTIEGTLDAGAKDEIVSEWTQKKLVELGFE